MKITKEIKTDILTPVSIYLRLQGKNKVILESSPRESEQSRFSIIAINPVHHIKYENHLLTIDGQVTETEDPLKTIEALVHQPEIEKSDLPFESGAIGYAGFDTFEFYEKIKVKHLLEDPIGTPDIYFMLYESYAIFDHKKELLTLVEDNAYSGRSEEALVSAMTEKMQALSALSKSENQFLENKKLSFTSNQTKKEFEEKVKQAKELIHQGDMFQIVLSQRLTAKFSGNAFNYYRGLRINNPSSYMYCIEFDHFYVIGCSPERLVAVKDGCVSTNPIAGTRKRGKTDIEDQKLIAELKADEKECAEHRMLVDLGRNDIGKISEFGTVKVTHFMEIEKYRYVMHITSEVKGKLKKNLTAMDALVSTLPAGTLSGAPKNRAYQRIYEFENQKRGIYGGAVGYLTKHDECDFAIAIRTMVLKDQLAHVQAGAGIVFDSIPEQEYEETLNKAKGLLEIGE
ncbi:MAG: anthranilate synthase component I [Lactococcus sp.]